MENKTWLNVFVVSVIVFQISTIILDHIQNKEIRQLQVQCHQIP